MSEETEKSKRKHTQRALSLACEYVKDSYCPRDYECDDFPKHCEACLYEYFMRETER